MTLKRNMTKSELQAALTAKGVAFKKSWSVKKLQEALHPVQTVESSNVIPETIVPGEVVVAKVEVKPEVAQEEDEKKLNSTVQALRQNARIVHEKYAARSEAMQNSINKLGRRTYVKRETGTAVEIYEKETNRFIRAYTLKDHGENYKKLADTFIETRKPLMESTRPIIWR